jgi:hypothetical protein
MEVLPQGTSQPLSRNPSRILPGAQLEPPGRRAGNWSPPGASRPFERPVDGAAADPERLGDLGHGDIASLVPGPGERDLLARQFGGPTAQAAPGPGGLASHGRPLGDELSLELGQRGEDMEGQPAGAGAGVDPRLGVDDGGNVGES